LSSSKAHPLSSSKSFIEDPSTFSSPKTIPLSSPKTIQLSSPKTTPLSSPTWLGIQYFLSFFVILIFCNSWNLLTWIYVFLSNIRRRNTSWIPAFAGMTSLLSSSKSFIKDPGQFFMFSVFKVATELSFLHYLYIRRVFLFNKKYFCDYFSSISES
jgi:hypothetical protein